MAIAPFGFGPWQLRVSEALTVLPYYTTVAVPGLFVGCLLANLISSYGLLDIVFGSLATLVAAALTTRIKRRWLVPLPSVLINAVVIGAVIAYSSVGTPDEGPFLLFAAQVGLGQLLSCYGLGMPLMLVLDRLKDKLKWTEETTR